MNMLKIPGGRRLCVWLCMCLCTSVCVSSCGSNSLNRLLAQEPDAAQSQPAAPESPPVLATNQTDVAERFSRLEILLLRSADLEAGENPARAALLQQAVQLSKQAELTQLLADAAARLRQGQYSEAIEKQKTGRENLKRLLDLLQSENRSERIREERDEVRRWIEKTDRLLRLQSSLRGRTEGGQDTDQAAQDQQKLTDKAQDIAAELQGDQQPEAAATQANPAESPVERPDSPEAAEPEAADAPKEQAEPSPPGLAEDTADQPDSEQQGDASQGKSESPLSDKLESDSKSPASDPAEQKAGEKPGKQAGDKPDEKQSGEKPSGEKPSGEKQSGEKPSGEKPSGEKQSGEKQSGEKQSGEKQSGEKQSGEGQPSGQPSPQTPPQSPSERAQQKIEQAQKNMQEAQQQLEQAEREGAVEKQRQAEERLREAIEQLEEILRQLREEEVERSLASLETRLRRMLEMQTQILDETTRLQEIAGEGANRQVQISASKLSLDQRKILAEGERAFLLLREEGSSAAFPEAIEQLNEDIAAVAERLNAGDVGKLTINIEQEIVQSLEEMVEALVQVQKENRKKQQQQQQGQAPPGGEPGDRPLVDKLAELRLIRTLQLRINKRTNTLSQLLADPDDPIGQAAERDIQDQLQDLATRQSSIQQVTRDIVVGKGE